MKISYPEPLDEQTRKGNQREETIYSTGFEPAIFALYMQRSPMNYEVSLLYGTFVAATGFEPVTITL